MRQSIFKNPYHNQSLRAATLRKGLTMLEVIFAMVVILVGLVSVGLLIPLAGRQANDSYQITQGLAAGESAIAMINTAAVAQPTLESPWCMRDDAVQQGFSIGSMRDAYDRIARTFPSPGNNSGADVRACVAQNEAIGIGFCIDPLFWGYQNRVPANPLPIPFQRTRFPCLDDFANCENLLESPDPANRNRVPRLLRVSLSDPQAPLEWLKQSSAVRLATMSGGDLVQASPSQNQSLGPLRAIYASPTAGNPLIGGLSTVDAPSWLMTVTPSENTPLIPLSLASLNPLSNIPVQIPRIYNVAIAVFAKRDPRDVNANISAALQNYPMSERSLRVTNMTTEASTSGTFSVTVNADNAINAKIKIGDWLMISRFTKEELLPREMNVANATQITRQIHQWYRVVGITGEDVFPRIIRVSGKPWVWTENEIAFRSRLLNTPATALAAPAPGVPMPDGKPLEITAVLLRDVVHVYERQIELQ
jgi:Tfp pilus assembly protein PilV